MATSIFKYQINRYLSIQPSYMTLDGIHKLLEVYGISKATFTRDRFLYPDDAEEIPQERLRIYASVLRVSTDQLTQVNEPEIEYGLTNDKSQARIGNEIQVALLPTQKNPDGFVKAFCL